MDIKKKLEDFNKRWAIVDNSSYKEEFEKFKKRVLNIFSDIDSHVSERGITQFCQILGITVEWEGSLRGYNIINELEQEDDEKKFYRLLQIISFLPILEQSAYRNYIGYSRSKLFSQLEEAVNLSHVNLSMTINKDEIIFHPKGEEILDKALVDEVLSFLNPESQKHFVDALNTYLNFSSKNAIKSAESLRRSLEEYLRYKLNNQQGLDKNIHELSKKLKDAGRDAAIRNVVFQTFSLIDQYFNENSKHKDGDIDEAENEFLIYQTGLLMRYIDKNIR